MSDQDWPTEKVRRQIFDIADLMSGDKVVERRQGVFFGDPYRYWIERSIPRRVGYWEVEIPESGDTRRTVYWDGNQWRLSREGPSLAVDIFKDALLGALYVGKVEQ